MRFGSLPECFRGTFYRATGLDGSPLALPISDFSSPVFQEKRRAATYAARLRSGEGSCFGFSIQGEVAAYFWLSSGVTVPLWRGLRLVVPPGATYVWDCRTHRPFVRQGLYRRALSDARRIAGPAADVWVTAEDANQASVAAIAEQFDVRQRYQVLRVGRVYLTRGGQTTWGREVQLPGGAGMHT